MALLKKSHATHVLDPRRLSIEHAKCNSAAWYEPVDPDWQMADFEHRPLGWDPTTLCCVSKLTPLTSGIPNSVPVTLEPGMGIGKTLYKDFAGNKAACVDVVVAQF